MAFPSIRASSASGAGYGTSTHDCTMPTHATGDLLVCLVGQGNGSNRDWTDPSGWTPLVEAAYNGSTCRGYVYVKKAASASETLSFDRSAGGCEVTYVIYSVQDWGGTTATDVTADRLSELGTANPNPMSLTSTFGAVDTLWIAGITSVNDSIDVTGWPTNYSLNQTQFRSAGAVSMTAACARQLNAASEDPGAFTCNGSVTGLVVTIAVKPAAAASTPIPLFMAHYRMQKRRSCI